MGQPGLNFPADARLAPAFGALLGARWLRVVLKPEHDLRPWMQDAKARWLKVLGVTARESFSDASWGETLQFYAADYGDLLSAVQIGNEPDHSSESSWTMEPSELNELLLQANLAFQDVCPIVGPGLVSGNPHYLDAVDLDLVDAIAVHPYGQRPNEIEDWSETPGNHGAVAALLDSYRYHNRPIWVTEVGVKAPQECSIGFQARYCEAMLKALKLRTDVPVVTWFCADDEMVDGFGLYRDGSPKPAAAAFVRAAGTIPQPEEPIMALPIPVYERIWKAHLPNAEFHQTWGVEKHWMQDDNWKKLGAVTDLAEYRSGKNAYRTFVGGVILWVDGVGASIV